MAATKIVTNAWKVRTLPDIFYEEPERIEDDMEQWPTVFRISGLLYERYQDRPDVFVNGRRLRLLRRDRRQPAGRPGLVHRF